MTVVPCEKLAYTIEDVAVILSCCPKTVRKLCREGKLRSIELGPRTRRIPKSALEEYIGAKIEK